MQGTVPIDWGLHESFPQLANLSLAFNPQLSGTLPQVWGTNNTSLRKLQVLDINNCNLTGALPAAWSSQLPALQQVNASSNFITGCLPFPSKLSPSEVKVHKLKLLHNRQVSKSAFNRCPEPLERAPHTCTVEAALVLLILHLHDYITLNGQFHRQYRICDRLSRVNVYAGTLPSQWSSLDLVVINLDRNALTGTPI